MKKFSLNKIASDGNYYAIQEICVKPEWLEQLRKELEEDFTTFTFPVSFEFVQGVKEDVARKKIEPKSEKALAADLVNNVCVEMGNVISRLYKGMRTVFVSSEKCSDEDRASFIIRSGHKKDALVCPWCVEKKRKNYRDCFQQGPFWLYHTIFTSIETKKGVRFLYVYRCKNDNKLFLVERPDSRFLESEFYDRCPYCEAGDDKFFKLHLYKENLMYFCSTCKLVFSVGGHPKNNVWELFQSDTIKKGIKWEWHEKIPYDSRSLDTDYY